MKGKHQKKPDINKVLVILGLVTAILDLIDHILDLISRLI